MANDASPVAHCFLALLPNAAAGLAIQRGRAALARAIVSSSRSVRWTDPAALHLTLRFLGPSNTAQTEYLQYVLPTLAPALPAIAALRYAIWPNRARPRLLVLTLEPGPGLAALACECETQARKTGFPPETREFRAHLTLARLRPGCAFRTLPSPPPSITFDAIALMQSAPTQPPAATYRELARVPLSRNPA